MFAPCFKQGPNVEPKDLDARRRRFTQSHGNDPDVAPQFVYYSPTAKTPLFSNKNHTSTRAAPPMRTLDRWLIAIAGSSILAADIVDVEAARAIREYCARIIDRSVSGALHWLLMVFALYLILVAISASWRLKK